jgi:plastocyanin
MESTGTSMSSTNNRNKMMLMIGGGLLALVAIVAIISINHKPSSTSTATTRPQAIVQITADGFTPQTLTVTAGTDIVWRNTDSAPHVVASNPYPQDSSVPGLHSKTIAPNSSYTYTPKSSDKKSITYHDENNPTHNGTITIE